MRTMIKSGWILVLVTMVSVAASGCAKDVLGRPSESPTLIERVTKEKVTGKVIDVGASHVSIRQNYEDKNDKQTYGATRRLRVDQQTNMDQVALGDEVRAYVSDDGYASTIQHIHPSVPASTAPYP